MNISEGGRSFNLSPEELRVVEAVSPTVDAERTEDGVQITVHDLHGTETVILNDGATGPAGPRGEPGPQGQRGERGETGATGETGPAGKDGNDGRDGSDGATFTPSVSPEGVISWTNDGGRENPQSINIKGPKGDPGTTEYDDLILPSGGIPSSDLAGTFAGSATAGGTANATQAIPFGIVDSTSTATVFTATVPGISKLIDGTCVLLKNGVVTSAANFTVNINDLGAKPVYSNMAATTRETTIFNINYTLLLVYDSTRVEGGAWINYRGYYSDANTIGYQVRTNSSTVPMDSVTYRYRLLFTSADGTKWVPANNSTSTNATAKRNTIQTPIDPFGDIVYYGTTASVAAGSNPSASSLWQQYALTLGYSFNRTGAALVLQFPKPIYLKCQPQADGSAIIESETPYVQALPSNADGKIYVYLGIAYSATNIELRVNHPVYFHDGGGIRLWNGQPVLPPVTSADDGKILKVVNGVWTAVSP